MISDIKALTQRWVFIGDDATRLTLVAMMRLRRRTSEKFWWVMETPAFSESEPAFGVVQMHRKDLTEVLRHFKQGVDELLV